MKFKFNGIISINEVAPKAKAKAEAPKKLALEKPNGFEIEFNMNYSGGKTLSKNFKPTELGWTEMIIDENGMVVQDWTNVYVKEYWKKNMEDDFERAAEEIVLSYGKPRLVFWASSARLIKYCLQYSSNETACAEVIDYVNRKIRWLNRLVESVKMRIKLEKDKVVGYDSEFEKYKRKLTAIGAFIGVDLLALDPDDIYDILNNLCVEKIDEDAE